MSTSIQSAEAWNDVMEHVQENWGMGLFFLEKLQMKQAVMEISNSAH